MVRRPDGVGKAVTPQVNKQRNERPQTSSQTDTTRRLTTKEWLDAVQSGRAGFAQVQQGYASGQISDAEFDEIVPACSDSPTF